jgi:EAL domain-containing protein (putative c-di-GMP-specific phosphodiesterase class I)
MASQLRRALREQRIVTHFQPKVSLRTDEVTGVEALMRWTDAAGAAIAPEEFIPVAEQTGLIGPATLMVMDAALAARQGWLAAGHDLTVAVNLSPRSLLDTRLPDQIAELLARHGVAPAALELEITESVLMADPERAGAVIERLGAMGLHLAVDDFGTGYSSLALLRRLPVDAIKIDRSFVMAMGSSHSDAVIVRSTVELARNLGMQAVAEGVDTVAAWRALRALGCDVGQGHLFGAAMEAGEVVPWIESRRASEAGQDAPSTPLHGSTGAPPVRGMTR